MPEYHGGVFTPDTIKSRLSPETLLWLRRLACEVEEPGDVENLPFARTSEEPCL